MSSFRNKNTSSEIDSSKIISGMSVEVRGNDPKAFDRAFRQFNKKVQTDGKLREVRERRYYTKPTTRKTMAKKAARARHLSDLRSQNTQRSKLF